MSVNEAKSYYKLNKVQKKKYNLDKAIQQNLGADAPAPGVEHKLMNGTFYQSYKG